MNKLFLMGAVSLLAACSSENQIRDSAQVKITAVGQGAESASETTKSFTRAEGQLIELETGLVNIFPLALERCPGASARSLLFAALDAVLPAAQAHGGEALEVPPGVFDAVGKADGEEQDLGSLGVTDGAYCGLKVALLPLASGDLAGRSAAVGPCYYADSAGLPAALASATPHECWTSTVADASVERSLRFSSPLVVQGAGWEYHVHLSVAYNRWFDGLDMDALRTGDAAQLAQLSQNMLDSLALVAEIHQE